MAGARGNHTENIMGMSREQVIQELDALGEAYDPDAPIEELRALAIAANVRDSFRRIFGPEDPSPEESRAEEILVEPGGDDILDDLPDDPHVETDAEIPPSETAPIEESDHESDESLLETEEVNPGCWNAFTQWRRESDTAGEEESEDHETDTEAGNDTLPDTDTPANGAIVRADDEVAIPDILEAVEPLAESISVAESKTEPEGETAPIEESDHESDESLLETEEVNPGCWNAFTQWWRESDTAGEEEPEDHETDTEAGNDTLPDTDTPANGAIVRADDEVAIPDILEAVEPLAESISVAESKTEPEGETAPIEESDHESDESLLETEEVNPGCWNAFTQWWRESDTAGEEEPEDHETDTEAGNDTLPDTDTPANGAIVRADDQTGNGKVEDGIETDSTEAPDAEESHVAPADSDTSDSQPDEISDEPIMPDQSVEISEEETTSITEDLNQLIASASAKIAAMQVSREENKAAKLQAETERTQITETGTKPIPGKHPPAYVRDQGQFLDGWADVIEGRGDKAKEVQDLLFEILADRQMPDIRLSRGDIDHSEFRINQSRFYTLTTTHPSGTTYIYVGNHGQDLFVSWRTFVKPVTNLKTVFTILGISTFVAAAIGFFSNEAGIYYYLPTLSSFVLPVCFGLTFGASALGLAYLYSLAGRISHGDAGYHFIRQPTLFDIDDFSAMSISVHKSLLAALERVGVEADLISTKQEFATGRKGQNL